MRFSNGNKPGVEQEGSQKTADQLTKILTNENLDRLGVGKLKLPNFLRSPQQPLHLAKHLTLVKRSNDNQEAGAGSGSSSPDPKLNPLEEPEPQQPSSVPADADAATPDSADRAARVAALKADKNRFLRLYSGRAKAPLRAELRALPEHDERRIAYEQLKARYAGWRFYETHGGELPPAERDPAQASGARRAALRRELARLPAEKLHALFLEFRRRFEGARRQSERARVEALPDGHPQRVRYERLHEAAKLVQNRRAAEERAPRLRALRDEYVREFLGDGGKGGGGEHEGGPGSVRERREAFERGEGEPKELARYHRLKKAYEEYEAKAGRGAADPDGEAPKAPQKVGVGKGGPGRPRKPLPADIPAAIKRLEPSAAEYRRLKLSYKEHIQAYLAGDDADRTRYKKYLRLRADDLEYRRLQRWHKAGYVGGQSTEDEFGDDVTALHGPPVFAVSDAGATDPAREAADQGHNTPAPVPADERKEEARDSRLSMVRGALSPPGIPALKALWRGSAERLTGAADRIKTLGNDIGHYAQVRALTSSPHHVYQRLPFTLVGSGRMPIPLPH